MSKEKFALKRIGTKLIMMFLAVSVIPIIIVGMLSNNNAGKALEESAYNQLESVGTLKNDLIVSFLDRKFRDMEVLSNAQNTIDAFNLLQKYHDNGGAMNDGSFDVSSNRYKKIYEEINPFFEEYAAAYNFYDIFFMCASHGHIMYTVSKEDDLGANLSIGEYRATGLAKLWATVMKTEKAAMTDFDFYTPSGENAAFVGAPVFNSKGELIAVIALQFSTDRINEIMQEKTGLGKSGETYLVGDDYLMRSDSRFETETTLLKKKIETSSVLMALDGEEGAHSIVDYRDVEVLSYYKNLDLDKKFGADFTWLIVAEIDEAEAFLAVSKLQSTLLMLGFIIAVIVALLALWFSKAFTKPILILKDAAEELANGNLTATIDVNSNDELGDLAKSFALMQKNLQKQLGDINEGVNVLTSSTSQIMSSVSELASGSAETATSVSETTSTIEEVKQTAEVSNQKAIEVSESAQTIALVSQDGSKSVQETIDGMNKIKAQMESIAGIVIQLSEKSHTISEIATTVNDLAEQSNLLAVNASIEAAKAGEQGKGFTVVAQEIKNLAERSKESTVQIRTVLADIQKEIGSAVMATEQGGKVIDEALILSSTASEVIITLAASVEEASQANLQIAASSQQQLVGMDQITSAMENIKEASNQTSESIHQTEESISGLNKLGDDLLNILKQYTFE
ncbi:MAG: hypothetical protein B7C24_04340 [Bacteroidetes bacterium 4572_77]|nr:MAG: hypothetical protein B7C24_04340 [Bacteroidetes bacterium 4572_77]